MTGLDLTTRLMLALAILLGLSWGAARIAVRIGQPPVLAEILVGVALGPSLLGRLLPGAHQLLFGPGVLPVVNGLAQLGVALYAFEIGNRLALPREEGDAAAPRALLGLTATSVLAPAAAALALFALLPLRRYTGGHGNTAATLVFLACALGVTAVPVLARLLEDRGLQHTPTGRLSLASASLGDGICWCLLALALCLAGRTGPTQLALSAAGALAAVVVIHRRHTRPVLSVLSAGEPASWALLPVLGLLCIAAAASSALGLHPLLGGLLLGAALPRTRLGTPLRDGMHAMAAVLLPCFFLGTGQQVDLGAAMTSRGFLSLTGALFLAAVLTKLLACTATGAACGLPRREALRLGVLMNTRGLTEIVVLTAGFQAGLIGPALFESLLVVALVTTLLSGPALALLDGRSSPRPPTTALSYPVKYQSSGSSMN